MLVSASYAGFAVFLLDNNKKKVVSARAIVVLVDGYISIFLHLDTVKLASG